jgi:hypothetical protein
MERQRATPKPEDTDSKLVSNSPDLEMIFPDESWESERKKPEFQSIYHHIKQFRRVLQDRRDTIAAQEGRTFAHTTYDNAYRLVSAAYFLLASTDYISQSGSPSDFASTTSAELRGEFVREIKAVLDSLGIDPQELSQKLPSSPDWQ